MMIWAIFGLPGLLEWGVRFGGLGVSVCVCFEIPNLSISTLDQFQLRDVIFWVKTTSHTHSFFDTLGQNWDPGAKKRQFLAKKGMLCSQFFRQAHFCKKTGAFFAKILALDGRKDGQNSSLARHLLRSATPLRLQIVIEFPKQLTNALNMH